MMIKITHKELAEIPGLTECALGGYIAEDGEIYKLFGNGDVRRMTIRLSTKGVYRGGRIWTSKNVPLRIQLYLSRKVGK